MLKVRVIPCLQLLDETLVKTVQFGKHRYIGDPINTVRIFNELEVDELVFVDISATVQKREPNYSLLREIANECFMPLAYGGGVQTLEQAKKVLALGFEKIIMNTASFRFPRLITEMATVFGSQAVVISIDVRKNFWGHYETFSHSGSVNEKKDPGSWAKEAEQLGAGEILLTSIDREGTWNGFDLGLTEQVSESVQVPVVANGGAGSIEDIGRVIKFGRASAVALGSMVVFQGKDLGVLVNFPDRRKLEAQLA